MRHVKVFAPLALVTAAFLIAYPLFAHCGHCAVDGKKIAAQMDQHKMTLAKVITAAEEHSKGRAISVISELSGDEDKLMVEVYCIAGDPVRIMMCHVDGTSGSVVKMKEVKEFPITEETAEGVSDGEKGAGATADITNRTVSAACGVCIYKMPGAVGCPLAVQIDGQAYLVEGAQWPNHDYCERDCQAVVSGRIEGDKFIATSFEPNE